MRFEEWESVAMGVGRCGASAKKSPVVEMARDDVDGARGGGRSIRGDPIGLPAEFEGDIPPAMPGRNFDGLLEAEPLIDAAKDRIDGASCISP